MRLDIGVLIIGSLYWDMDGGRGGWREQRLQRDREWLVKAPIRYGRLSRDRGIYTMVFSRLSEDQFGQAKVVGCRNAVSSLSDLVREAEYLWAAERKCPPDTHISSNWGCVALMSHPQREIPQDLLDGWSRHVATKYQADDGRLVNCQGMLQIVWTRLVDGSGSVPLDLLLATSNSPTLPYPSVEAIADRLSSGSNEYFRQNRNSGIQTFQDSAIAGLL